MMSLEGRIINKRIKTLANQQLMVEEITKKQDWDAVLNEIGNYDFYHTYDYHMLSKRVDEKCVLLVYREHPTIIAIPLIIRFIEGTNFNDVTSVYGYAGPISKNMSSDFDNSRFREDLNSYFKLNNIISVFSRLNPYIDYQKEILNSIGECHDTSEVVAIDLTKDLDSQRREYQRRIKSQINKARRLCSITKANSKEDIDVFIDIYYENMDRVNAAESYYFERSYFYNFIASDNFKTDVLLATCNETNEVIAGALFVKTNKIVQYHLSGTKSAHLDIMPIKMLIDEMRILATNEGYEYLNLGGGYAGVVDSLLRFKMSFSKNLKPFRVWKHIVHVESYNELALANSNQRTDYFPAYR